MTAEIQFGNDVKLYYVGKLEDGTVFDQSSPGEPLEFVVGAGDIIEGLEKGILGLKDGDKKTVTVSPELGYGEHNPQMIAKVMRDQFPENFPFKVGQRLTIPREDGTSMEVSVVELSDTEVTLDGNHPFAGKTLIFDVEIVQVA